MIPDHDSPIDARAQAAVAILQELIRDHYPATTFNVQRGEDDPQVIHLIATVDLDDTDAVLDLVLDRMMAFQIDDGIPVFVIPIRPPERVYALLNVAYDPLAVGITPSTIAP